MLWPYSVLSSSSYELGPGAAKGGPHHPGQDWAPHQEGRTITGCRPSCTWTWLRTWAPAQISRQWEGSKSLHLLESPSLLSSGSSENSFHLLWLWGAPCKGTVNAQCANRRKTCLPLILSVLARADSRKEQMNQSAEYF